MLLPSTNFSSDFLLHYKPHFIHLISLFISLITLWSHLLGTDPQRDTQYSCLSSAPSGLSRSEPVPVVSRGALVSVLCWLRHCSCSPGSCLLPSLTNSCCLLTLQFFLPISSCSLQNTSILQKIE